MNVSIQEGTVLLRTYENEEELNEQGASIGIVNGRVGF